VITTTTRAHRIRSRTSHNRQDAFPAPLLPLYLLRRFPATVPSHIDFTAVNIIATSTTKQAAGRPSSDSSNGRRRRRLGLAHHNIIRYSLRIK